MRQVITAIVAALLIVGCLAGCTIDGPLINIDLRRLPAQQDENDAPSEIEREISEVLSDHE